jgi:cysteinyl-tRNA synthetase
VSNTPADRKLIQSLHNTATRKTEPFVPMKLGEVKLYVCGPTVYDFLHIGNFRGAIFFNMVRNWFERAGNQVTFVYNYTDVDDKIIQRANKEGVESSEIANRFIAEFEKDYATLGLKKHTHNPRVTQFIEPIVKMIEALVANGKAYVVAGGEVLYSVRSFEGYGKLSGKNLDDLKAGIRVEIGSQKQDPLDFTLWKPSKPGEPKWSSPWGEGRPGWHIECSAMAYELLGQTFDIHGGGIDLIFPHHENEIAQSEGCTGHTFVRYWMHNNFINFGAQKMSKSLGNVTTARAFLEKYNAEILKFMILAAHYRTHSDFSPAQISNAISGLARVYSALAFAEEILGGTIERPQAAAVGSAALISAVTEAKSGSVASTAVQVEGLAIPMLDFGGAEQVKGVSKTFAEVVTKASRGVEESMADDFNTPGVMARMFEVVRAFNAACPRGKKITDEYRANAKALMAWVLDVGEMLSLFQQPRAQYLRLLDDQLLEEKQLSRAKVDELVVARTTARTNKDYARSDELRNELLAMGIVVNDGVQGTTWEVQK